jgi:hypothetical protein
LLQIETGWFVFLVSLSSEKVDFICETKRKLSEMKQKREIKRKKRSKNKQEKNILKQNEWETASIYFYF